MKEYWPSFFSFLLLQRGWPGRRQVRTNVCACASLAIAEGIMLPTHAGAYYDAHLFYVCSTNQNLDLRNDLL